MDNVYIRSAEIVKRVRLEMPIHVTLNDPIMGGPITVSRDNMLELLVVESHNLILEGQTVAALYAEMGRFRAAAQLACARAENEFRKWKARMAQECRAAAEPKVTKAGKPAAKQGPTGSEIEEYYRLHDDYDKFCVEPQRLAAVVDIFTDLRRAFDIKDNVITDQLSTMAGHESTMRAEASTERLDAYAHAVDVAKEISAAVDPESLAAFKTALSSSKGKSSRKPRKL